MPREKTLCKPISIIMIDSVVRANKRYYPQTLLEECKYVQEKIKNENSIDDELEKGESVTLIMKQNLILIMINMTNNLLKVF